MHNSNRVGFIAPYPKILGNFENKHKQKKCRHYQNVQQQLHVTAAKIGQNSPQRIHPITGLYFWAAIVAPNLPNGLLNIHSSPQTIDLLPKEPTSKTSNFSSIQNSQKLHRSVRSAFSVSHVSSNSTLPLHPISRTRHTMPIELNDIPIAPASRLQRSVNSLPEPTPDTLTQRPKMALRDPAKSIHVDAASSCLASRQDKMPIDLNNVTHHVIALLVKNSHAPTECSPSVDAIVKSALVFSERDIDSHAELASAIQKAHGHYGGHIAEIMSFSVQKLLIRDWITRTILGENIEKLLENDILTTEKSTHLTSRDLSRFLANKLSHMTSSVTIQEWLMKNVILEELPILRQFFISDGPKDPNWQHLSIMKLHDFEFGQINAGLHFARSLELDLPTISIETAAQWGKILLAQLQEGVVPQQWWKFFQLSATIRYMQYNPDLLKGLSSKEKQDMNARALVDYISTYEEFIAKHNPISNFTKLIASYKTRHQLAQQIIDDHCPGMSVSDYLNRGSVVCLKIPKKALHPLDKLPIFTSFQKSQLPDINNAFQSQVNQIADSYKIVNKLLVITAWRKLADEDIQFINSAHVKQAWAEFSAADELNFMPFVGANPAAKANLKVDLEPSVELFSVQRSGQKERIYALQQISLGYTINRIDRDVQNYFSYLGQDKRPIINSRFKLKVHTANGALKRQEQGLEILIEAIAQKHRDDFAKQWHKYGFEPTTLEKMTDVMLSLIPFYTCLTSTEEQQLALSCTIDVMLLFPVLGELSRLSLNLVEVFGTASLVAARGAATEMARRGMLQEAIRLAGPEFIRYASLNLKTIAKEELKILVVTALRAIDPGIELIGSISIAAVKQSIRLGKTMASRLDLYARLDVAVEKLPSPMNHNTLLYGQLPGINNKVPVIRLSGDRFHGKEVYVQIYPGTQTVFGRKYILWPDGSLEAIPIGMARRLRNILEQGLGGKGAVEQSANWVASKTEMSATVLRQIQQGMANGDSLVSLANQHEVPQTQLERYISFTGELTAQGHDLIDAAKASPARDPTPPYGVMQLAQSVLAIHAVAVDHSINRVSENSLHHLAHAIPADENVKSLFFADNDKIQTADNTYFTYDLDLDVFRMDKSEESSFVYTAHPTSKDKMLALTMEQALKRKQSISLDQRTAVVKALGIDLNFCEILASVPLSPQAQTLLPRIIRYVWVGDRAISPQILENMRENALVANDNGYQIHIYLSEKSQDLNLAKLKEVICDLDTCLSSSRNHLHILENSHFYKNFKQSENFAQYQDAIDGNGGIATNFASAADILRYALLQKKGGLYMDMDDQLLDGLRDIELKTKDDGIVFSGLLSSDTLGMQHQFGTSFFGVNKGNSVLKDILQEIYRRYQQNLYQNFYKTPRPKVDDSSANKRYIDTLFSLTGPGVFNDVIREQLPDIKRFMEFNKLSKLSHHYYASDLFQQLSKKILTAEQISPLKNAHVIGNLHSWQHYR